MQTAYQAGNVVAVIGVATKKLVRAGYSGNNFRRILGTTTDHILPLCMPYRFLHSLNDRLLKLTLQSLLPYQGLETVSSFRPIMLPASDRFPGFD